MKFKTKKITLSLKITFIPFKKYNNYSKNKTENILSKIIPTKIVFVFDRKSKQKAIKQKKVKEKKQTVNVNIPVIQAGRRLLFLETKKR
jgi:hypothetical protein